MAALLWAMLFLGFAQILRHPAPPPPRAIDAKIVVLPTPPPVQTSHPERPRAVAERAPRPMPRPRPRPEAHPHPVPHVLVHRATVSVAVPAPPPQTPSPTAPIGTRNQLAGGGVMGARAIYRPDPVIPDDLREHALNVVAVARFQVAVDGTATVELVQATAVPELNEVLLETLRTWRFFPAIQDGKPVVSMLDIRIPVQIH